MKKFNIGDEVFVVWREHNEIHAIAKVRIKTGLDDSRGYSYTVAPIELYYNSTLTDISESAWTSRSLFQSLDEAIISISKANKKRMFLEIFRSYN